MIRQLLVILALASLTSLASSSARASGHECSAIFNPDIATDIQLSIEDLERSKEFLSKIDRTRAVAVLGSARLRPGDPAYDNAVEFGKIMAQHGYIIVTGGGLGIMEAANKGAKDAGGETYGVVIQLPHEKTKNPYMDGMVSHRELYTRMEVLVRSSSAYVYFDGGLGTLQELTHVLSLMQNRQMAKGPVVLVGRRYWQPLVQLLETSLLQGRTIAKEDMDLFKIVDTPQEAYDAIKTWK